MVHKGAGVILITKDRKVLLNLRDGNPKYYKNLWSIIGGGVEEGEEPKEAAFRELQEETGYKTDKLNYLQVFPYIHESGDEAKGYIYWTEYDGVQEIECNEGLKMEWATLEEMESRDLIAGQKDLIKSALEEYKKHLSS